MLTILPPEISVKILKLFNLRDVLACQAVSKSWYALINDNIIWKSFWETDTPLKECRVRKDFNWTFDEPCQWKMNFLNHMRIINNWKKNNYKRHEINGKWIRTTGYDGQTLIINNNDYLDVYKIYHGSLLHVQKLKFINFDVYNCVTSTKYICVKYIPFILVYHLIKGKYKVSHLLYNQESDKEIICIKNPTKMDQNDISMKYEGYPRWSLMCILGDTLFMSMPHLKVYYAWNLKKMKTIFTYELLLDHFINDSSRVYVCSEDLICVYDQFGSLCFKINCKWPVGKLLVNNNIILAVKRTQYITEITTWDKNNGTELLNRSLKLSFDCILHPKLDILVDIADHWNIEKKEMYAYDVINDKILWKNNIREYSILGDLHSVVAERFVLFSTYSRHIFNVHDIKSGNYLYSLNGIDNDDVFASYDILIHSNNKNFKLIVHVYS